jgi:hypothetical protein
MSDASFFSWSWNRHGEPIERNGQPQFDGTCHAEETRQIRGQPEGATSRLQFGDLGQQAGTLSGSLLPRSVAVPPRNGTAAYYGQQHVAVERLQQVFVGTGFGRADNWLSRAVGSDDDKRHNALISAPCVYSVSRDTIERDMEVTFASDVVGRLNKAQPGPCWGAK